VHYKLVNSDTKTYAVVFETGDELVSGLSKIASDLRLASASFTAIGALSSVRLGWLDWQTKKYQPAVVLDEQVELLSLIGNVAQYEGKPWVHAHAVVAKSDGIAHGGHLLQAVVRPTCEIFLTESPAHLLKEMDPEAGIPLIKFD
jgi:uncharacterized protein